MVTELARRQAVFQTIQNFFLSLSPAAFKNPLVTTWFTGLPHPFFNLVMESHFTEQNIKQGIEQILSHSLERQFPICWWVSPFATPRSLEENLKAKRFALISRFPAMVKDLSREMQIEEPNHELRIRPIVRRIEANPWGDIVGGAFAFPPIVRQKYIEFAFENSSDTYSYEHYLGFIKEKPVTTGTLFLDKQSGTAGIYNIATSIETQKHGFASQMMLFLIGRAKTLNYDTAVMLSSPMFEKFCLKIGFQESFNISLYAHAPKIS